MGARVAAAVGLPEPVAETCRERAARLGVKAARRAFAKRLGRVLLEPVARPLDFAGEVSDGRTRIL